MNLNPFKASDYNAMSDSTLIRRYRIGHFLGKTSTMIVGCALFAFFGINLIPAALATAAPFITIAFLGTLSIAHLAGARASYKIARYLQQSRGIIAQQGTVTPAPPLSPQVRAMKQQIADLDAQQREKQEQEAARKAQQACEEAVKRDTVLQKPVLAPQPLNFGKRPRPPGGPS